MKKSNSRLSAAYLLPSSDTKTSYAALHTWELASVVRYGASNSLADAIVDTIVIARAISIDLNIVCLFKIYRN
nr:hypothetical protein [Pelagibacteraceae bacterium]